MVVKNLRRSRVARWLAAVVVVCLAVPVSASAVTPQNVWSGTLAPADGWHTVAPRHSLTAVDFSGTTTWLDVTNQVTLGCVNAWNDPGGGWAGSTYCGWSTTSHPYCACQLRIGYAAAASNGGGQVTGNWTQWW